MTMAFDSKPFNCDGFMEKSFLQIKKKHRITHVIETGTYHGITTRWLAHNFHYVFTIEVMEQFYTQAMLNLSGLKNVVAYLGDSKVYLPMILKTMSAMNASNILVFLDSHWYENPLLPELNIIAASGLKPVICIHDMQNPNDPSMGYDSYPDQNVLYNFDFVKPGLDAVYGPDGYSFHYNNEAEGARRGALFVYPK